jgi:phage terminase large subunit-like protein
MLDLTADSAQIAKWSTAVPDWAERIVSGRSIIPVLPLHEARASKALRIFKQLWVPDIEGNPTYGEVCDQFVFDLVRAIFGAFDEATQLRTIREYFLLIPKKNGKSSIAAAIIVTAAILNERPSAELLLIAPTINIASISYKQASGIIRLTEMESGARLDDLFSVHDHEKKIRNLNPRVPSEIAIKAADADVITGSKASFILIDETHVFATRPAAKGVFVEIRGALSHPQNKGFLLQITTQSKTPPQGVFKSELQRARDVRDGKLLLPLMAVLYELPVALAKDGGWKKTATWAMVNPHLNRSVSADFLADEVMKAEADGPEALALCASQHFNVEIGQGQGGDGWAGARHWAAAALPGMGLDELLEQSEVCTIGVDWGGADDLASLAVIGRRRGDKVWLHWQRSWARPSVFEERKSIAPALLDFKAQGDLWIMQTGEEQADAAADICAQVHLAGKLPVENGIGLDVAGVALLIDALEERGMADPLVRPIPQGWQLQAAISTVPLKLEDRRMLHCGQSIMGWAVGNAKQELRGSNYVVTKQASGAAKIDPLMATFNAAMLMFRNPVAADAALSPWDADPAFKMVY